MKTTQDEIIGDAEQQRQDALRAQAALDNYNSLLELMRDHNILIPARMLPLWRPTKRSFGVIAGIERRLELIATDGLLGWFLTEDEIAWCGHIHCFDGEVAPLHSITFNGSMSKKPKQPRKKSKRTLLLESM